MKNKLCLLLFILLLPINVHASKIKVKLNKCIDGDTISVTINKEEKKVRLLAVDSPEIDKNDAYAHEAKDFTCNILSNSKQIYLEYDKNSDRTDKYDRLLAWVWADDILLQKELIKEGYASLSYLYGDYKYTSELSLYESEAKNKKLNIWSNIKDKKESKKKSTNKKKFDIYLDRLSKSYEIFVIVIAGILALITLYLKRKK